MARTKTKARKQPSQGQSQAPTPARAVQGLKALTKRIVQNTIINKVAQRSTKVFVSPAKATVGKLPAKKAPNTNAPSGKSPRKSSVPARKLATKKSSLDVPKMPKRKRRRGVLALMEIRKFQRSTDLVIRKAPFTRLVREILQNVAPVKNSEHPWLVKKEALLALQEACEAHMVTIMEETQLAALHAQRVTIMPKDLHLAKRLRMDHVLMQDTFQS